MCSVYNICNLTDHLIASAPNTGSIVLWDLNSKAAKNKIGKLTVNLLYSVNTAVASIDHVFKDIHTRAVNKICFHPREINLLISGSQDATMLTIVRGCIEYDMLVL